MYEKEILTTSAVDGAVPSDVYTLAKKLASKHGTAHIAKEASGHQIYIADPELLTTDGLKELQSRHLAVNADMYLGIGDYDIDTYPNAKNLNLYRKYRQKGKPIPCCMSMKTKKIYTVEKLLRMPPLEARSSLFKNINPKVISGNTNKRLVRDENGNLVPEWCGDVTPLTELPYGHPAKEYLEDRGYDLARLEEQFEACYCHNALPEDRAVGRFYSRTAAGVKNSHQGRIVFVVRMHGVRIGYQSRYIDKWIAGNRFFWTDNQQWLPVEYTDAEGNIVPKFPKCVETPKGFSPHKYVNATGAERNKMLMGFDAAIAFNKGRPLNSRYCILVEGPLDAGRLGPPAIALLGKSMSIYQAAQISRHFGKVLTVMDNDKAGQECLKTIHERLPDTPIVEVQIPTGHKDVGELTYEEAKQLIKPYEP